MEDVFRKLLYKLKEKDIDKAVEVFTRAFNNDPLTDYMFQNDKKRIESLRHYFRFRITYGILFGEVYAPSQKIEGVAIWFKSEKYKMTIPKLLRAGAIKLFLKIKKETRKRMIPIGDFTTNLHSKYDKSQHWYLDNIGIDPEFQGKGYGSVLIRSMLKRIDSEQLPCLLETQTPTNVQIYQRYGFEIIMKEVIPDTNILHWIMIRQPQEK